MAETGGPTTQSGIYYQNSIAALYLGRLCDPRPFPNGKRVTSVRIEAPELIDDILVEHADGTRLLIQAKEAVSSTDGTWKKLWRAVEAQACRDNFECDDIVIIAGKFAPELVALTEALERSRGKEDFGEWWQSLSAAQRKIIKKVIANFSSQESEYVFSVLRRTYVEHKSLEQIETVWIRDWIPPATERQETLFALLRDSCGGHARVRKTYKTNKVLEDLYSRHRVEILAAPHSKTEEYRQTLLHVFGRISVPGTQISGSIEDLFLWPSVARRDKSQERNDFEEEDFRFRRFRKFATVELENFPQGTGRRAVIDAGAGFGKSSLLRAIAHKLAKHPVYLPAFIPLDALVKYQTVDEFLSNDINRRYRTNIDWVNLCDTGRAVLLLDGLDELDEAGRIKTANMIELFISRNRDVPFLLTVRDSSILAPFKDTNILDLLPLDQGSITAFVRNYCNNRQIEAREFLKHLDRHPDIKQLVRVPLYLAILLSVLRPTDPIPSNRREILERYLATLFNPERYKEGADSSLSSDELREAAEVLAHEVLIANAIGLEERVAANRLKCIVKSAPPSKYIQRLIQNGLLQRYGTRLRFHFPILQEYLAACRMIAVQLGEVDSSFPNIVRRPWAQALQFALELHPDAGRIIQEQLKQKDDAFATSLRLIARCIVNGATVSEAVKQDVAQRLIDAWRSKSHYIRRSIGSLLADGFTNPCLPELEATLKQPFTGHYGRGELVRVIDRLEVTFDLLNMILQQQDIRELRCADWHMALMPLGNRAITALLERAKQEEQGSLTARVISEVIFALLDRNPNGYSQWKLLANDTAIPAVVRLAVYRAGIRPIPSEALELVNTLLVYRDEWGSAFDSIQSSYLEIEGWREHLFRLATRKELTELESMFWIHELVIKKHPQTPLLVEALQELGRTTGVPDKFRFHILLSLAIAGDGVAAKSATNMLSLSKSFFSLWGHFLPYLPDQQAVEGIECIANCRLTAKETIEILGNLSHSISMIPTKNLSTDVSISSSFVRRDFHPASKTLIQWADGFLRSCRSIDDELCILASIVRSGETSYLPLIEDALNRRMSDSQEMSHESWDAFATALIAATMNGNRLKTQTLWRAIYKYPDFPMGASIAHIIAVEGTRCHDDLLRCYEDHPSPEVRATIFEYFERTAPRLGIRVIEEGRKLLLTQPTS